MTHEELMTTVEGMLSRLSDAVAASEHGRRLLMAQLTGSHAYGLATPQSDVDLRAMHLGSSMPLLGVHPAYTPSSGSEVRVPEEDSSSLEIGKVCHLCLQGNPSALELLFVPRQHLLVTSPEYEGLADLRHSFVSQKVPAAYLGYTWSNLTETSNHLVRAMVKRDGGFVERLLGHAVEDGSVPLERWLKSNGAREKLQRLVELGVEWPDASESRALKAASHVTRLLMALEHLLAEGELLVDLGPRAEEVRAVRRGEVSLGDFYEDVLARRERVERLAEMSSLPERPDYDEVNAYVTSLRLETLDDERGLGC